jgi:hypothetical protein
MVAPGPKQKSPSYELRAKPGSDPCKKQELTNSFLPPDALRISRPADIGNAIAAYTANRTVDGAKKL